MLAITPDRYNKAIDHQFDECNNAFVKPKRPVYLDLLENLHKKSDYQQEWSLYTHKSNIKWEHDEHSDHIIVLNLMEN